MDETYIKVAGQWKYLYRAVNRAGDTVDFLLTAKRDLPAARQLLECAINLHDLPEKSRRSGRPLPGHYAEKMWPIILLLNITTAATATATYLAISRRTGSFWVRATR